MAEAQAGLGDVDAAVEHFLQTIDSRGVGHVKPCTVLSTLQPDTADCYIHSAFSCVAVPKGRKRETVSWFSR